MFAEHRHPSSLPPDIFVFSDRQVTTLPPNVILNGIEQLVGERTDSLYGRPLTDEQEWYVTSHLAVLDLVEKGVLYKENKLPAAVVLPALRYMRFLGYTKEQTSKNGIESAAAESDVREDHPPMIPTVLWYESNSYRG